MQSVFRPKCLATFSSAKLSGCVSQPCFACATRLTVKSAKCRASFPSLGGTHSSASVINLLQFLPRQPGPHGAIGRRREITYRLLKSPPLRRVVIGTHCWWLYYVSLALKIYFIHSPYHLIVIFRTHFRLAFSASSFGDVQRVFRIPR